MAEFLISVKIGIKHEGESHLKAPINGKLEPRGVMYGSIVKVHYTFCKIALNYKLRVFAGSLL